MEQRLFPLSPIAIAALLAGCAGPGMQELDQEAGLQRNAYFGDATMNNVLVNSGDRDPLAILAQRFGGEVPDTVTFEFDSAEIGPEAAAVLDAQARWMTRFAELGFKVYGHADSPGSTPYNDRLGRARAQAAVDYLASRGVSPDRLEALVSYGERRPAIPGAGRERANRRVVTEVSHFMGEHDRGELYGKYAKVIHDQAVESAQTVTTLAIYPPGDGPDI